MKNLTNKILILIILIVTLISCKKDFDFKQDDTKRYVVIEGGISNERLLYLFRITRSEKVLFDNIPEGIKGAFVTINDDFGNIDTLKPYKESDYNHLFSKQYSLDTSSNGKVDTVFVDYFLIHPSFIESIAYITTKKFIPIAGRFYTLTVKVEGKVFWAKEYLPLPPHIDSVSIKTVYRQNKEGYTPFYYPLYYFNDDPLQDNYYMMIYPYRFTSGVSGNLCIIPDKFIPQYVTGLGLGLYNTESALMGISVWGVVDYNFYLYSIPKNVYECLKDNILASANNGVFTTIPATPKSNINGGALGYFFVGSYDVKTVRIP